MWLFASNGFLSVVADPNKQDTLIVRSREKGVIEHFFPKAEVVKRPERDYLYRAFLPRELVAKVVAEYVLSIEYTNYKNSIPLDKNNYHNACHKVWHVMADIQETAPYSGIARNYNYTPARKQKAAKR